MPRLNISSSVVAFSLTLFALPLSAYALVDNPAGAVSQTSPSVIVFNQKPANGQIIITYAFMPSAGHLIIHGAKHSGKADENVVASVKLDAGSHNDVAVKLDKDLPAGTVLWASLTNSDKQPFWKKALPLENEFLIK